MANLPNQKRIPIAGPDGFVTREWLRFFENLVTAASSGDVAAVAASLAALSAQFVSLAGDVAGLESSIPGPFDDLAPPMSTSVDLDAFGLTGVALSPVAPPPVGEPLLTQLQPCTDDLHSQFVALEKRVTALEQGAP